MASRLGRDRSRAAVVDPPRGPAGRTDVSVSALGGGCRVALSAHAGGEGGVSGQPLIVSVADDCRASEDPVVPEVAPDAGPDGASPPGETGDSGGCQTTGGTTSGALFGLALLALAIAVRGRGRA
jgi:hypothetical protein